MLLQVLNVRNGLSFGEVRVTVTSIISPGDELSLVLAPLKTHPQPCPMVLAFQSDAHVVSALPWVAFSTDFQQSASLTPFLLQNELPPSAQILFPLSTFPIGCSLLGTLKYLAELLCTNAIMEPHGTWRSVSVKYTLTKPMLLKMCELKRFWQGALLSHEQRVRIL